MSHYTSLALVSMADDTIIPAPPEQQLRISGIAPGHWINFVTWSHDGATLAFTLRSAGAQHHHAPLQSSPIPGPQLVSYAGLTHSTSDGL